MYFDEDLSTLIALSWDCGAITTGEVTVPVIVGLGSGASTEEYESHYAIGGNICPF